MKVAVAAAGPSLDAPTEARFGRCPWFVIVETETMEVQTLENPAAQQGSGAGIAAAQTVANAGAEAVIAAHVGPNAHQALTAGGLKVYSFAGGSVRQAVEALKAGQLQEVTAANVPSHFGMGAGAGLGRGARCMGVGMGAGNPSTVPAASATTEQLKRQADELEAQLRDLQQQIAQLQTQQRGSG